MSVFFYKLTSRQQITLVFGSLVVVALLLCLTIWRPLNSTLADSRQEYGQAMQTLETVTWLASEIRTVEQNVASSDQATNLTAVVNTSLQERQLEITRLQQQSEAQLQIRLDNVEFGAALGWIHDLENTPGLVASEITMRPATQPDRVNLTVGLSRLE